MEIEIQGYKGNITDIKAIQDCFTWPGEDTLVISLTFMDPGEPPFFFIVTLPARKWSRENFLQLVKDHTGDRLAEILAGDTEKRWERWQKRQEELDAIVDEIKAEIGWESN